MLIFSDVYSFCRFRLFTFTDLKPELATLQVERSEIPPCGTTSYKPRAIVTIH
jgi:hypothetical protein